MKDITEYFLIIGLVVSSIVLAIALFQLYSIYKNGGYPDYTHCGYSFTVAPSNYVDESQIIIYPEYVIINVSNVSIGRFAPSGSMLPILDEYTNGLRVIPKNVSDIHLGDIITYEELDCSGDIETALANNLTICSIELIIHRIIAMGNDSEGIYYIPKGDNNRITDRKIRFNEIRYKSIGFIY